VREPPGPHDPDGIIMPTLVQACPSFEVQWAEHVAGYGDAEDGLVYVALGALASHLVSRLQTERTEEFQALFEAVERLFAEGDAGIRNALKVGLLEGIQNVGSHSGWPLAARFRPWLGPRATGAWNELHAEWGTTDTGDVAGH
jgi:hypothetical protein